MTDMRSQDRIPDEMKLEKTNLFLGVGQRKELRTLSRRTMIPISALIRKAIDEFLDRELRKKKPKP
jgi:hypothetical protein